MEMNLFKTRQMIAKELSISRKTLEKKLQKAGIELPPGLISPKNQQIIYDFFGIPITNSAQNVSNLPNYVHKGSK
jgi:hypothetical protein